MLQGIWSAAGQALRPITLAGTTGLLPLYPSAADPKELAPKPPEIVCGSGCAASFGETASMSISAIGSKAERPLPRPTVVSGVKANNYGHLRPGSTISNPCPQYLRFLPCPGIDSHNGVPQFLTHAAIAELLDYLVGAGKEQRGNSEPKQLGSRQIDD
jgi:hypothetical protein